jgi:hypothetical protein
LFTAHSINIRPLSDKKRENVLYTLNVEGAIAPSYFVAAVLICSKAWLFGLHPSLDGLDQGRFDRLRDAETRDWTGLAGRRRL